MALPHNENRRHAPGERRLSLLAMLPTGGCLAKAKVCPMAHCRYHLGAERTLPDGHAFRCALDAASSYPGGLIPAAVAILLGVSESEVQTAERAAAPKMRVGFQRLKNEERERARQARHLARTGRPAPPMPVPPLATDTDEPDAHEPDTDGGQVESADPRQLAFDWPAAAE